MVESLNVSARLELNSNVPQVINQMIQAFDKLNTQIKTTQDALSRLASKSGPLNRMTDSLDKLAKARLGTGLMDDMTMAARRATDVADAAERASSAWKKMAATRLPAASGASSGGGSRGGRSGALMDGAIVGNIVGDAGLGLAGKAFMANANLQRNIILAEADKRVTPVVMQMVRAKIADLQKQYPALKQGEGISLFSENMGVFGDPNEALATLPGSVRLQQLYQLRSTGQGGTGNDENLAAAKAGDALQAFVNPKTKQIDVDLFNKWIAFQTQSVLAGGGIVDAKSWLTFARSARTGGISLNNDAMEYTQGLLELSPGRTGTAIGSAFQLFGASTSHLTDKTRAAWAKAGLLGKDGNIVNDTAYQADPYTWIWNTLLPNLAKQGITSRQQILAWLSANGQRATVSGLFADIAVGQANLQKTKTRFDAQDPNTGKKLGDSDIGKLAAFNAAQDNFLIALGQFEEGPGVKLLVDLTNALNNLTAWATAHPGAAKTLALTGVGIAALAKAAGDLALTIYLGAPLVKGLASIAKSGTGLARAGAALVTTADGLASLGRVLLPFAEGGPVGLAIGALVAGLDALFGLTEDWNKNHTLGRHNAGAAGAHSLAPAPYVAPHYGPYGRTRPGQHAEADSQHLAKVAMWIDSGTPVTVRNTGDIARGANAYGSRQAQKPNMGASGVNLRSTPSGSAALAMPGFA